MLYILESQWLKHPTPEDFIFAKYYILFVHYFLTMLSKFHINSNSWKFVNPWNLSYFNHPRQFSKSLITNDYCYSERINENNFQRSIFISKISLAVSALAENIHTRAHYITLVKNSQKPSKSNRLRFQS